jgi:hypothetical protein
MPETPGPAPEGSHGEAGTAGETVQVVRRDVADYEQQEAGPNSPTSTAAEQIRLGREYITGRYGQQEASNEEEA